MVVKPQYVSSPTPVYLEGICDHKIRSTREAFEPFVALNRRRHTCYSLVKLGLL
jgi:hypothetical protein